MGLHSYKPDVTCMDRDPESSPSKCDGALQRSPKNCNLELFYTHDMPHMSIDGTYLNADSNWKMLH